MSKAVHGWLIGIFSILAVGLLGACFVLAMAGYSGPGITDDGANYLFRTFIWGAGFGFVAISLGVVYLDKYQGRT